MYLSVTPARPGSTFVSHSDSVYVRFQFVRVEGQELVFEAEFSNASDHPIVVNPAEFYYLPLTDSLADSLAAPTPAFEPGRRLASDPEPRLAALATQRDEQAAKAEKVGWFELLTMAVNTAEDISKISKKETAAQEAERETRHENSRAEYDNERIEHANNAQALHSTIISMAGTLLRRAILQPGDQVVGLVHFPRLDAARQLQFVLAFDEQRVPFGFTQEFRKQGE